MAVIDKLEPGPNAGLGGATWSRDQALVAQVREVLARRDVAAFAGLMESFGELVEDSGPLGYLRFAEDAFGQQVAAALHALSQGPLRRDAEALCEALHVQVTPQLCPKTFLRQLRDELQTFLAQPYVPRSDQLAACTALLTLGTDRSTQPLSLAELPPLYAIFRAQLIGWLEQAGRRQEELLRLALALRGDS
ncbi:MAG: hypothetical protein EOO78_26315 [Oxalobacteraceae bacterium]|nr:MAG: hypothetical protein EOO78_26315 [Oxalobacteraceae bacterium]